MVDYEDRNPYEEDTRKLCNVDVCGCYKRVSTKLAKAIRYVHRYSSVPGFEKWLGDYYMNDLNYYDVVIIMGCGAAWRPAIELKKKFPDVRIIFYLRDPLTKVINPYRLKKTHGVETWTFSRSDAEQYKLNYNHQFFSGIKEYCLKKIEYDVFFVGGVNKFYKKRVEILKKLSKIFDENNITYFFGIVYDEKYKGEKVFEMDHWLDEQEYLNMVEKSRVMLDLIEPDYSWMTLRPLEALWYKKKLITNFKDIQKEDFYIKENVYILEDNDERNIVNFLNSEWKEAPAQIYEAYSFKKWLENFGKIRIEERK